MLRAQHDSSTIPGLVAQTRPGAAGGPAAKPRMTGNTRTGGSARVAGESCIVIAPNCSLTQRAAAIFVVAIGSVSLAVAGVFAVQGYWPILPFAGAEIALLAWAMRSSLQRGRYREILTVNASDVVLERGYSPGERREIFSRHWLRPRLEAGRWQDCRVVLAAHGRRIEVGACLSCEERKALYKRLRQVLKRTT